MDATTTTAPPQPLEVLLRWQDVTVTHMLAVGATIWVGAFDPAQGLERYLLVDAATGTLVGPPPAGVAGPEAHGPLIVGHDPDNDRVNLLVDGETGELIARLPEGVGNLPTRDGGSVWGVGPNGRGTLRYDVSTTETVTYDVSGSATLADGLVWVGNEQGLTVVDPQSGDVSTVATFARPLRRIGAPVVTADIAVMMDLFDQRVAIVDRATGEITEATPTCPSGRCAPSSQFMIDPGNDPPRVVDGWVVFRSRYSGALVRVDPTTGEMTEDDFGIGIASALSDDGEGLWWTIAGDDGFTSRRIDLDTMTVGDAVTYRNIGYTTYPALVDGWVWAAATDALLQLDPETLSIVARHEPALSAPIQVGGRLWVPCADGRCLREILP